MVPSMRFGSLQQEVYRDHAKLATLAFNRKALQPHDPVVISRWGR